MAGEGKAPPAQPGSGGELPERSLQCGNAEAPAAPQGPPQILPHGRRAGTGSEGVPDPAVLSHSLQAAASPALCLFLNRGLHFKAILPM